MNPITKIRRAIERFLRSNPKKDESESDRTGAPIDDGEDDRIVLALNETSTPEQLNTLLHDGRPAWQEAFNRFCLSDAGIDEWAPLLDRYLAADMLNGPWIPSLTDLRHGFPSSGLPDNLSAPVQFVPMWVHALFRMPAFERKAELERLLARGADITREGIARHTVFDPEGLVQACFDAFPEVRIHVEGAELREAMAASSSAPGAPRGRKRL
ncbi:hypothetical protein SAMN05216466_106130 [Paraburkholderia phenazinium]|uniref:Uncharacterized protein n=1 Tax=Paraburkholderia phenazinium TaxID=60549 RepID=A0A1G7YCA1_9BURK|nr:hypothetical protein [Paraburkholderia phenazinium]SDG94162.1 hypothetical protein SAMN05216466_106130 [Paraburkholderia phenazinium]